MSIIGVIILLLCVGVGLWLINTYLPMEPRIKQLLNVLVIVAVVIWILVALARGGVAGIAI